MSQPIRLFLALAALCLAGPAGASVEPLGNGADKPWVEFDPKDGPDVDLRVAIEDGEVRLAIITNLAFLDETTAFYREADSTLDEVEASGAMEALFDLFKAENGVTIDGTLVQPLAPRLERDFEFDPGDPALIPHFVRYGARAVAKTRITMRYPCKSAPKRVAMHWGVYPPNAQIEGNPPIEVICRVAAVGVERIVQMTADEPEFTWHREREEGRARFAEVPPMEEPDEKPFPWLPAAGGAAALLGLLFGPRSMRRPFFGPLMIVLAAYTGVVLSGRAVALPTDAQAVAIFEPLHENIYRAFDYTADSDVYDALSQSVDGDLLSTLYDEVYRSLVLQEAGGAVSRVAEVRHDDVAVESIGVVGEQKRPGFTLNVKWQVDGIVFHWGHAHSRTNEYRARYTVHAAEEGWRIMASEPLEQRRVDAAPMSDLEFATANGFKKFGLQNGEGEASGASDESGGAAEAIPREGKPSDLPDEF